MPRLPLNFVQCVSCGHVFNDTYDYANVPYSELPNLMFNKGINWTGFIEQIQHKILSYAGGAPTIVEIGHGDGSFLAALAALRPDGKFVGFDPHGADGNDGGDNLSFRQELFDPLREFQTLQPDIIISRHVLEHLSNPLGFLQQLSFAANYHGIEPHAYFEVPCIDRVLKTGRTCDFYYEHSSHFTTTSFTRMLERSTLAAEEIGYGYDTEVIYTVSKVCHDATTLDLAQGTRRFRNKAENALNKIQAQLDTLHLSGKSVAIWGGTGKSCAFICRYEMDNARFPVVVDSDLAKVGTYVPGTGQKIRFRDWLQEHPVDVIIIPPQWRARDIMLEMEAHQITCEQVLIEHDGSLVDFVSEAHPYKN